MQSLPSFPYPPAQDGYWSPVTSTLNWCEEVCEDHCAICPNVYLTIQSLGLLCYYLLGRDCEYLDQPAVCMVGIQGHRELPQ